LLTSNDDEAVNINSCFLEDGFIFYKITNLRKGLRCVTFYGDGT